MKKNKLTMILLSAGMAMSVMTGCRDSENDAALSMTGENAVESTDEAERSSVFPETEEVSGKEMTTEDTEKKETGNVVVSSVSIVEILDEMEISMAGVPTSSYELPESVADAVRIGNPMSPDMEIVTSLEPDYIISVNTLEADLGEQFAALGAETYYADLSGYEALKKTITDLGSLFGTEERAAELVYDLEEKEALVKERVKDKTAPDVLIIFGAGDSFMAASESTYAGDLVRIVGGKNVVGDAPGGFIPIDMEYLAEQDPDYILLLAHANPEESLKALRQEFETNEAWQNFKAVKNEKVYALESGYFGMSANLLAGDALEKLCEILYREM